MDVHRRRAQPQPADPAERSLADPWRDLPTTGGGPDPGVDPDTGEIGED